MEKTAVKIPLRVDKDIETILDGQSKIANWLYNQLLEIANDCRNKYSETGDKEAGKKLYGKRSLRNLVPELKKDKCFLRTVYSSVLKNVALRLERAIKDYKSKKKGWPRFRSIKEKWFSLEYDEPWKGYWLDNRTLKISLGKDEFGKQIQIEMDLKEAVPPGFDREKVVGLRIIKEGGIFYAIFTVKRDVPDTKTQPKKIIALDPNHKNLSYGVNNSNEAIEIKNPWFLKSIDAAIDKLRSKRDRCEKKAKCITREDGTKFYLPSRRWTFFNNILQKMYNKRREQTKVYLYTIANKLFKEHDVVAIGDYTPHGGGINTGMRRSMNNQSLIGRFKKILSWVAIRSGKTYRIWDEKGSTKTCNVCCYKVSDGIKPEIREWDCPKCHTSHIRDENAAINGLKRVVKKLLLPCSGHLEVISRCAWWFNGLGITPGIINR